MNSTAHRAGARSCPRRRLSSEHFSLVRNNNSEVEHSARCRTPLRLGSGLPRTRGQHTTAPLTTTPEPPTRRHQSHLQVDRGPRHRRRLHVTRRRSVATSACVCRLYRMAHPHHQVITRALNNQTAIINKLSRLDQVHCVFLFVADGRQPFGLPPSFRRERCQACGKHLG